MWCTSIPAQKWRLLTAEHGAVGGLVPDRLDVGIHGLGTHEVLERGALLRGQSQGLGLGLGGAGAQGVQLLAGQEALLDHEVHEPVVGLEQGVGGPLLHQDGLGHHTLLGVAGGGLELTVDQTLDAAGHGGPLVAGGIPGHIGQRPLGNLLAGFGLDGGAGHEESGADAVLGLAVDGVLGLPNLAGAGGHGLLQGVLGGIFLLTIAPGAEGDLVQVVGVGLGVALGGDVLQGPQAHDIPVGIQRTPAAGGLQIETEAVAGGIPGTVLGGVHIDEGNVRLAGNDVLGRPLLPRIGHVGSVLGQPAAQGVDIGDGGVDREGLVNHLVTRGRPVVHGTGLDVGGGRHGAVAHHTVGGQSHQHSQTAAGLALLGHDVGNHGAGLVLLVLEAHGQLGSVAHHIAGDIAAGHSLSTEATGIHIAGNALAGRGGHRGLRGLGAQVHGGDAALVASRKVVQICHNYLTPFFSDDSVSPLEGYPQGGIILGAGYKPEQAVPKNSCVGEHENRVARRCNVDILTHEPGVPPRGCPLGKGDSIGPHIALFAVREEKLLRNEV